MAAAVVCIHGDVAQMVERSLSMREAAGSMPAVSILSHRLSSMSCGTLLRSTGAAQCKARRTSAALEGIGIVGPARGRPRAVTWAPAIWRWRRARRDALGPAFSNHSSQRQTTLDLVWRDATSFRR